MKEQHTPGPWQVNRKVRTSVETVADGQGFNLIADCSDPDNVRPSVEDRANAALIAAAPELLAALEQLVALYPDSPIPEVWDEAREAIAKARAA